MLSGAHLLYLILGGSGSGMGVGVLVRNFVKLRTNGKLIDKCPAEKIPELARAINHMPDSGASQEPEPPDLEKAR
jgi:hypothetical protein